MNQVCCMKLHDLHPRFHRHQTFFYIFFTSLDRENLEVYSLSYRCFNLHYHMPCNVYQLHHLVSKRYVLVLLLCTAYPHLHPLLNEQIFTYMPHNVYLPSSLVGNQNVVGAQS